MALRVFILGFVLLGIAVSLTGCGIKPGSLEPPPGAQNEEFPRTYPDPSTDPAP